MQLAFPWFDVAEPDLNARTAPIMALVSRRAKAAASRVENTKRGLLHGEVWAYGQLWAILARARELGLIRRLLGLRWVNA